MYVNERLTQRQAQENHMLFNKVVALEKERDYLKSSMKGMEKRQDNSEIHIKKRDIKITGFPEQNEDLEFVSLISFLRGSRIWKGMT